MKKIFTSSLVLTLTLSNFSAQARELPGGVQECLRDLNFFDCLRDYVGDVDTLYSFNSDLGETPESVVIDSQGNFLISMALTGEVRKISPSGEQSSLAVLPIGDFDLATFSGIMGALVLDRNDNAYINVSASEPANRGVWKVTPDGTSQLIAPLPATVIPNGIALRRGKLFIADSAGLVWKVSRSGGVPEVWSDDPALQIDPSIPFPGPNGIQFYGKEAYVSNPNQNVLIAIKLNADGTAGESRVVTQTQGCDDFAIDIIGNIYCTTDPFNTVVRIKPNGEGEVILTAEDGLDGPTAAIFGRSREDRFSLYITNAAFPFFTTTFRPSLMKVEVGLPGARR